MGMNFKLPQFLPPRLGLGLTILSSFPAIYWPLFMLADSFGSHDVGTWSSPYIEWYVTFQWISGIIMVASVLTSLVALVLFAITTKGSILQLVLLRILVVVNLLNVAFLLYLFYLGFLLRHTWWQLPPD